MLTKNRKKKELPGMTIYYDPVWFPTDSVIVEFSSQAVPQPFLDPSILKSRFQANQQWKLEEEITLRPDTNGTDGFYAARLLRLTEAL